MKYFANGIASYRERSWANAVRHFEMAIKAERTDRPSRLFRERALHYQEHGPADDWDGVWTLAEKLTSTADDRRTDR